MSLPETMTIEIAPTVFRKSAVHKKVTILSVGIEDMRFAGYVWYQVMVGCEGKTFKAQVSVRADSVPAHVHAGLVHQMVTRFGTGDQKGELKERARPLRRDSGLSIAIRRACEIFVEQEFKKLPPVG